MSQLCASSWMHQREWDGTPPAAAAQAPYPVVHRQDLLFCLLLFPLPKSTLAQSALLLLAPLQSFCHPTRPCTVPGQSKQALTCQLKIHRNPSQRFLNFSACLPRPLLRPLPLPHLRLEIPGLLRRLQAHFFPPLLAEPTLSFSLGSQVSQCPSSLPELARPSLASPAYQPLRALWRGFGGCCQRAGRTLPRRLSSARATRYLQHSLEAPVPLCRFPTFWA